MAPNSPQSSPRRRIPQSRCYIVGVMAAVSAALLMTTSMGHWTVFHSYVKYLQLPPNDNVMGTYEARLNVATQPQNLNDNTVQTVRPAVVNLAISKNVVANISAPPDRNVTVHNKMATPPNKQKPYYGGLKLSFSKHTRVIVDDKDVDLSVAKKPKDDPPKCHPPQYKSEKHENCLAFHELALEWSPQQLEQDYDVTYLASGFYRQSFLLERLGSHNNANTTYHPRKQPKGQWPIAIQLDPPSSAGEASPNASSELASSAFVMKRLLTHRSIHDESIGMTLKEAMVMEGLSGSVRTSDIYGYCSTSVLVQPALEFSSKIVPERKGYKWGKIPQTDLDKLEQREGDVHSFNKFSAPEKLYLALGMAEALAGMHNYKGGVIAHDDFHPDQFLITKQGRVIMNDMNTAQLLDWDPKKKRYCKFWPPFHNDEFRGPEEFEREHLVDEKTDLWSFGNNILAILTGLGPYYNESRSHLHQLAMDGTPPHLNDKYRTRSMIERRLTELMDLCLVRDPSKRLNASGIVKHLRETLRMHREEEGSKRAEATEKNKTQTMTITTTRR